MDLLFLPGNKGPTPRALVDNYSTGPGLGGQAQPPPGCRQQTDGMKAGSDKDQQFETAPSRLLQATQGK